MNLDAVGPCHEAENVVSEYRVATAGHLVIQALKVLGIDYQDVIPGGRTALPLAPRGGCGSLIGSAGGLDCPGLHLLVLQNIVLDDVNVQCPLPDGGEERVHRRVLELLHQLGHIVVRKFQLPVLQPSVQQFLALGGLLVLHLAEDLADLVPRLGRYHNAKPAG